MNYEKVKLFLAFSGLLEDLTLEQEDYIADEMKTYFTNEELREIHDMLENSKVEFEELVKNFIQDFKNVLFK